MRMRRIAVSVFAAMLIASCDVIPESSAQKTERGRTVFAAECSSCHGPTGGGTAYGGDLQAKFAVGYSYAKFSSTVMSGRRRTTPEGEEKVMPRFAERPVVSRNLEAIYLYLSQEPRPRDGG